MDWFWGESVEKSRLSCPVCLLRPDCSQHRVSNEKNIGQRRRHEHAVAVLGQTAIAHFGESKHPLDDADRMLDSCPDARLVAVLCLDRLVQEMLSLTLPVGEVLGLRRLGANDFLLALVRLIAVDPRLLSVQQLAHDLCNRRCSPA